MDTTSPDYEHLSKLAHHAARRVKDDEQFAADVAQDVMEKLVMHPSRLPFAEAFVQQVARNRALDLVRGPRGEPVDQLDPENDFDPAVAQPGMRLSDRMAAREDIRQAIIELNPKLAEALLLYEDGYRAKEVAEMLGVAPGTVRNWLVEVRRCLADMLRSSPNQTADPVDEPERRPAT